ncbi:g3086 [Coccomyxa elongata]
MSAEDADIFQRLAEAEQHIVELRSRIIGLTALNADLTKKLKDEVTETTVLKALEARNAELQAQIIAANKEISGLQADLALAEKMERRMLNKVATAEKERQNTEINLLNSGPISRAQVERVAALNARIEELESQLSGRRPVQKLGTPPPRTPRIEMPVKDSSSRDMIGSKEDMQQQIIVLGEELSSLKQKLSATEEQLSVETQAAQTAQRSLEEEAKVTSILQEQLAALKTRLEEAHAASAQGQTSDNNTGGEELTHLQSENARLASLLAHAEVAAEEAAHLRDMLEAEKESRAFQEGMLDDALARQKRAEEAAALALEQLEQERSVAVAARERSKSAAADGLADREEKTALKAQLASLQAEVSSLRAAAKKAAHEAEQRASELSSQQLQHSSLRSAHEGALKELDAMHTNQSSAAKRAEEALAELALVRETQQALTKQAQQLASVHAQQAAAAREELEEVKRRAADSIRASGLSTEQLRELEHLRERVIIVDQERDATKTRHLTGSGAGPGEESEVEWLRLQLRHVEGELAAARGQASGIDVNLAHVDDVIALKTQVANLMAELESERHAAREVAALAAAKAEEVEELSEKLALAREMLGHKGTQGVADAPLSPSSQSSEGSRPSSPPEIDAPKHSSTLQRLPSRFLAPQLEQLPRRSPRMLITPRQIEDRSQEIQSLKTELAGLRDELRTVRGQLASAVSASAAAEGRVRLLSSQVKERDDAIAQMREEHDAAVSTLKQVTAEAAQLRRNSVDQELPGQELAVLQANYGAMSAKHEEALGKLAILQAAKEAAESSKASALAEAAVHQQNARTHAIRSEEKQAEIEELRAEVRRGEARLRTLHRDMKAQQDKAELHSKFSAQYLAELEDLRTKHAALQAQLAGQRVTESNGHK